MKFVAIANVAITLISSRECSYMPRRMLKSCSGFVSPTYGYIAGHAVASYTLVQKCSQVEELNLYNGILLNHKLQQRSILCATTAQSMDFCAKHGSLLCAGQSMDCAKSILCALHVHAHIAICMYMYVHTYITSIQH